MKLTTRQIVGLFVCGFGLFIGVASAADKPNIIVIMCSAADCNATSVMLVYEMRSKKHLLGETWPNY